MLARVKSVATVGLSAIEVLVEVDVATRGFPAFEIVGLPDKAVGEARARVKKAIENSGAEFPAKRITVNLAPADLPKVGSNYDLPIAIGILLASQEISDVTQKDAYFLGELGLDGSLKPVKGVLLASLLAKSRKVKELFVPKLSAAEGAVVEGVNVRPIPNLLAIVRHLRGDKLIDPLNYISYEIDQNATSSDLDMSDVAGQEIAKRAAEIAGAGGHNLLLVGPPGAGKTMIAKAFPGILPALSSQESLEVTRIYSVAGLVESGQALMRERPYRAPHHTTSMAAMIGGGSIPMPGEVSLAHLGVLYLDEMPEFPRSVIEVLRQPLEDGRVAIARANAHIEYPANFMLVASANPCPCGYLLHPSKECICGERNIAKYRRKLSGPILDRIDLHVMVEPVELARLTSRQQTENRSEKSSEIRERVALARSVQAKRYVGEDGIYTNAQMSNRMVKRYCELGSEESNFLQVATRKLDLSARAYFKVIKVARTIADLAQSTQIHTSHIAEAIQYRESVW